MNERADTLAERLAAVCDEFQDCEPRERLELLLEFAENLPPLSPTYQAAKEAGEHRVHECQTPVYLWAEVHDGHVELIGDVAPESPTVQGFVGLLADSIRGATPDEVDALPADLVGRLGLVEALGMVRMRGLHAILHRVRTLVREASA